MLVLHCGKDTTKPSQSSRVQPAIGPLSWGMSLKIAHPTRAPTVGSLVVLRSPASATGATGPTSAIVDRSHGFDAVALMRHCWCGAALRVLANRWVGSLQLKARKRLAAVSHGLRRVAESGIAFALDAIIPEVRILPVVA